MTDTKVSKDRVFKAIFVDEKSPFLLETLIYDITKRKIKIIAFLDKELPIENVDEKVKIVDVLAQSENEIIHIEVNASYKDYTRWRNFIYLCKIISGRVKVGEEYNIASKYISINLTRGLPLSRPVVGLYQLQSKEEIYLDNIEIYEVNVDKTKTLCYNEDADDLVKHISALIISKEELKKQKKGDKFMKELSRKVEILSGEDYWFTPEEDYHFILNTERHQGKREGIKEGLVKGKKEKTSEIALNMLKENISLDAIIKCTGLSENEVNSLKEFLNTES